MKTTMSSRVLTWAVLGLFGMNLARVQAGDSEWATAGKILTGVVAGTALARVFCPPVYEAPAVVYVPPPPPAVVYVPAPVVAQPAQVVVQPARVVVHPAPVVYAPPPPVFPYAAPVYMAPRPAVSFHVGLGFGHPHYHYRGRR